MLLTVMVGFVYTTEGYGVVCVYYWRLWWRWLIILTVMVISVCATDDYGSVGVCY